MKQTVLFICTHNSARSQLAEGLLRHLYDDRYAAFSAGSEPAEVNPYALRVLVEAGVDTQGQHAKGIDVFADRRIDIVVTVCDNAREACPHFPGTQRNIHQGFDDPSRCDGTEEERLEAFRKTRDTIKEWIILTFG